jgi:hypothetical protein
MKLMVVAFAFLWGVWVSGSLSAQENNFSYIELTGTASEFREIRDWASYYWRDDVTFVLRDASGKSWRIISRELTPWTDLRLGPTYTGLKVEWSKSPQVQVIGVAAVDRIPREFYDLKIDGDNLVTALIVRVRTNDASPWRDFYVNNWFHPWGQEADAKVLAHFATDDPHYTIYGFASTQAAPFDAASQKIFDAHKADYSGIIYHARVRKADNPQGYELSLLHLMGRHTKTLDYGVFHGDPATLAKLDQRKPQ